MKCVYCAKCGTRLAVTRKALPKYGRIIDIVEYHECPDEPVELDLTPIEVLSFDATVKQDNKFVQNLNILNAPHFKNPGDRRKPEHTKSESSSTAPRTLLDSVKSMYNSTPANDIKDEPDA